MIGDLKNNEGFEGSAIDINEILAYQQQLSRYQSEQLHTRKLEEELRECTFHPQTKDFSLVEKQLSPRFPPLPSSASNPEDESSTINRRGYHGAATSTRPLGVHRTLELYSLAKPNNQRRDKEKGDIEYERECDECTFSPDISNNHLAAFNSCMNSQQQLNKQQKSVYEQRSV